MPAFHIINVLHKAERRSQAILTMILHLNGGTNLPANEASKTFAGYWREEGQGQDSGEVHVSWEGRERQSGPLLDGPTQRTAPRGGASIPAQTMDTHLEWTHEGCQCYQVTPQSSKTFCSKLEDLSPAQSASCMGGATTGTCTKSSDQSCRST